MKLRVIGQRSAKRGPVGELVYMTIGIARCLFSSSFSRSKKKRAKKKRRSRRFRWLYRVLCQVWYWFFESKDSMKKTPTFRQESIVGIGSWNQASTHERVSEFWSADGWLFSWFLMFWSLTARSDRMEREKNWTGNNRFSYFEAFLSFVIDEFWTSHDLLANSYITF